MKRPPTTALPTAVPESTPQLELGDSWGLLGPEKVGWSSCGKPCTGWLPFAEEHLFPLLVLKGICHYWKYLHFSQLCLYKATPKGSLKIALPAISMKREDSWKRLREGCPKTLEPGHGPLSSKHILSMSLEQSK